jgi:hypothetical protein
MGKSHGGGRAFPLPWSYARVPEKVPRERNIYREQNVVHAKKARQDLSRWAFLEGGCALQRQPLLLFENLLHLHLTHGGGHLALNGQHFLVF